MSLCDENTSSEYPPAFQSPEDDNRLPMEDGLNPYGSKVKRPPAVRRCFEVVPHEPGTKVKSPPAVRRRFEVVPHEPGIIDALSRLIQMARIGKSPGTLKEKPKTVEEREKYCRDRLRGRVPLDPSVLVEESGDFFDPLEENGAPKFCNIKKNSVL